MLVAGGKKVGALPSPLVRHDLRRRPFCHPGREMWQNAPSLLSGGSPVLSAVCAKSAYVIEQLLCVQAQYNARTRWRIAHGIFAWIAQGVAGDTSQQGGDRAGERLRQTLTVTGPSMSSSSSRARWPPRDHWRGQRFVWVWYC